MKWKLFNIFKRSKKEGQKDITWMDVSYKMFLKIKDAEDAKTDEEKVNIILEAFYGADIINTPITEYNEKIRSLKHLMGPVPNDLKVDKVKVNGRTYIFKGMIGDITAAQYIDFQKYIKDKDEVKTYSVFFLPEGHEYNDGYDMYQVFEDILDMPIPILLSASFFFNRQLLIFTKTFQRSLIQTLKKTKLTKKTIQIMKNLLENFNNLEYYHMS